MIRSRRKRVSEEMEINLIPVMDIFVALIPFLLLTAAFVRLSGVGVSIPSTQNTAASTTPAQDERVQLTFQIEKDHILVSGFSDGFRKSLPEAKRLFTIQEMKKLSAFLDDLHGKFMHLEMGIVHADATVSYRDVMLVLDTVQKANVLKGVMLAAGGLE